jgi:hypothetical protein
MLDNGISASQIQATAGVTFQEAQAAAYMLGAAASGWSLCEFQERTKMCSRDARDLAFRFGVAFSDYDPFDAPAVFEWRKAKKGWELVYQGDVVGTCNRLPDDGRYCAQAFGFSDTLWDARSAMRNVSRVADSLSFDILDGRVVQSVVLDKDGNSEGVIFPVGDENLERCRSSLLRKAA